ncbi:MAG: ECF transporter S component [Solobacterium sp.]|nr:ECF transporter S component [Solobacterium sp.]
MSTTSVSVRSTGRNQVRLLTITALFLGMVIALSSFGIPVPGGHLYLNDVVIAAAALLLDSPHAFLVGGVGAFLGDLFFYPTPMFVSLVTHGLQGIAISLVVQKLWKNHQLASGALAVTLGVLINVVGYTIGRAFLYATPETAMLKLPFQFLQAGVGALIGWLLVYKFGLKNAFEKYLNR